ncbi:Ig-like domain-containing protein [Mycolicibacterium sp. XJ662]
MAAAARYEFGPSNYKSLFPGGAKAVNPTAYARYVGRVGALAVALGVGVAVATGGSGLAWADAGSTGDSQSAGTSAGQGGDGDSDTPSTESGSADDAGTSGDGGDDDAPDADDPDGDEPAMNLGSSGSVDTSVNDAGQSTDTTVPSEDEVDDEPDLSDELESDVEAEDEGDGAESTSVTTEPAVSQRSSGSQSGALDEADSDSGRIDDVAPVIEDVVERDDDDVTEPQESSESLTSQVVLDVENVVDEHQVSTTVVSEDLEAAPESTGVSETIVDVAGTFVAALLSPFLAPSPVGPAEPPLAWALLAFARREWQHMLLNRTPAAVVDDVTTSEDTPITVDVVSGTDPDAIAGDVVNVIEVTQPQNGTVTVQGGTLTYTPNSDFHGTDTFTYTISDEDSPLHIHGLKGLWAAIFGGDAGHATTVTVSVTVTPVNDAPVAVDDAVTVAEDSGANIIDVLGNDTDADGDQLAVTEVGAAFNGTTTLTNGVITYTPDTDFSGTDFFTYTVSDGNGGTSTAIVSVTVTAVQDAPAPQDDAYITEEDTPLTIPAPGVLDNDIDVDGDDLSALLINPPVHGSITLNGDGSFTYTPFEDFHGLDSFTYAASDGNGGSATATVYVRVTPVNDAPVANDDNVVTDEDESIVVDVVGNDSDADRDTLVVIEAGPAGNGTVAVANGVITYTPDRDFNGADSFTYTVTDGNGGTATATVYVTVNPVNDAPVAVDDAVTVDEDSGATVVDVLGNDTDIDDDDLSVTAAGAAGNGTVTLVDGVLTYTPDTDFHGTDSFTYTISDSNGGTATATVTVTVKPVNDDPVAVDDDVATDEDTPVVIDVLANDDDIDRDELAVAEVEAPNNGSVTVSDGKITYTPNADFHGTDSFTYTVSDGNGGTSTATVYVTVNPVNDAPVAVDDFYSTQQGTELMIPAPGVMANDFDVDGDELQATVIDGPTKGIVSFTVDGAFLYTPNPEFHGDDSFTYSVYDGDETATATVYITVEQVNTPPVANPDEAVTEEGIPVVIDVLANDSDADAEDDLAVSLVDGPANGVAVLNADGTITYTPSPGFSGRDTFTYQIDDGTDVSEIAMVQVEVRERPIGAPDINVTTDEDNSVSIDILARDPRPGGAIPIAIKVDNAENGVVEIRSFNGERFTVIYRPAPDFFGTDSFTYVLVRHDGTVSNVGTVTITVDPVNDDPVAVDDFVTVRTNSGTTVVNVLGNDTDVDGDELTVTEVGAAGNGTATLVDGVITYTPDADFLGTDMFTYTISDGNGGAATATVRVTVNNPAVANPDFASTEEGMPVVIDVLANDSNVDGLRLQIFDPPYNGTAEVNEDGTITYTPSAGFTGSDHFRYETRDDTGRWVRASVNIQVRERTLVANDVVVDTDENSPGLIFISARDNLPDGETNIAIRVDSPENGVVRVVEQSEQQFTLKYTPPPHFIGTDSFTYHVVGADGRVSNPYTVTITVNPVTGGPRAIDDTVVVDANSDAIEIVVLGNDFDVNDGELAVVQVSDALNGTVTVAEGVITYRPNAGFDGLDSFTYTVANDVGAAATATVTVTVKDADAITFEDGAQPSETLVSDDLNRIVVLTGNELRIVDRITGRIDTVDLGANPSSVTVSRNGHYAYVATKDGSDVSTVRRIDLWGPGTSTPVGAISQATAMAADRDNRTLYVADYQDATVSVIDTRTGEQQIIDIGLRSNAIAVSEFGETLYVGSTNNEVWAVDLETESKTLVYSGAWDDTTVADPGITVAGEFVYVADRVNNAVAVINTFTNETYAVYDIWASPTSVAASRYGGVVLVASAAEEKVTVISLELGVVGAFEVDGLVDVDFARHSEEFYVTTRDGISTIPTDHLYALFQQNPM